MATMREHLKNFLEVGDKVVDIGSLSNGDECLMLLNTGTFKTTPPTPATIELNRDRGKVRVILNGNPHEINRRTPVIVKASP